MTTSSSSSTRWGRSPTGRRTFPVRSTSLPSELTSLAARRIPDLDTLVVVYCANPECESSVEVTQRLLELGYRNVLHYAGGKEDWRGAGLPLEGARI